MYPGALQAQIAIQKNKLLSARYIPLSEPTYLPLYLTGGIGDVISSINTIHRLKKEGFQTVIFSKHSEVIQYFLGTTVIVESKPSHLKWYLELDSVARFHFSEQFSGFILPEHEQLFRKQQQFFQENPKIAHLVKIHPKKKYLLTQIAEEKGKKLAEFPLHTLGYTDIELNHPMPRREMKDYITIHDGYDVNTSHIVSGRCTKTWKWSHWNEVVKQLKCKFPDLRIIQLGSKTSRPIDGVDESLLNKTTLTEAFDIISHSQLHLDTDSGLVHAATALSVPCVVIFGPTPLEFYGYSQNKNMNSKQSCLGGCFFVKENWMDRCTVGYNTPQCMDDVSPEAVIQVAGTIIGNRTGC